ncbi:uncharacterized protein TNIN_253151 [Trichonephila inaurata madagascariensis]|uniref:DUF7153 domain-containing protein n=1 Tax=Trichonephila inaurata madagascariensis TaxID=2747483 RepID=A0A8X6XMX7_9ARAC|nr:uncharacterized protein TNIN_174921 [Trichonephila inaurata madagascariensis]GFY56933.1 uncharacterized protein TNIN_253151 [Trichonephila inaurata madagascariensis]
MSNCGDQDLCDDGFDYRAFSCSQDSTFSTATPHVKNKDFFMSGYEEVASIVKPSLDCLSQEPVTCHTGYIISAFRVFPGEDREKLEKNWLTWTGARQVYNSLPKHLGLKRLTFHKKLFPDGGITYVLMCECSTLVEHVTEALVFVDHLRARCCGYTALYRPVDVF